MSSQLPHMDFPVSHTEGVAVIQLPNRLSILEAVDFKHACDELLAQANPPHKIVLDFRATQFIDSSAIGALVHNYKAAQAKRVEILLENVRPPVMAVLSLTNLDQIFSVVSTLKDAQSDSKRRGDHSIAPETHPSIRSWVKRLIDITGALVGLTLTGFIFLPVAIAIRLDSSGPIFFGQERCGWLGKRFRIWKFRSMCVDAEKRKQDVKNQAEGAIFKNKNDPRITRVGRFLRRTSLDEFPQFYNVLRGEMSLVGTRPPTVDEVERYEVPAWQRLDVKPGMTGEWQVNGRSNVHDFEDVIKLDLRYQQNWSLSYDAQLILKTVWLLFNRDSGAV
ncbi:MAG: anti-sigma factor antagonist [Cyanobacteria bacterium P01_H01_bin.15]